jgi:hypothetical protein
MKGHMRERSPGKWAIVLDLADPVSGKRKRKWHAFSGTKREAQTECARLIAAMSGGSYTEPAKTTVAQFFERWLAHMASQVAPRTHERYSELALKNIVPLLGAVRLSGLRPEQIGTAYAKALANGRRDGAGGLSPRSSKAWSRQPRACASRRQKADEPARSLSRRPLLLNCELTGLGKRRHYCASAFGSIPRR